MVEASTSHILWIPMLTSNNYKEWIMMVQSMARMLTVSDALKPNTKPISRKEKSSGHFCVPWQRHGTPGVPMWQGGGMGLPKCHIKREIPPHMTAQQHALKHEFLTLSPMDGKAISKFIAKIDESADKDNEKTRTTS